MQRLSRFLQVLAIGLVFLITTVTALVMLRPSPSDAARSLDQEEFLVSIRQGLGSEVVLPGQYASLQEIRTATESMAGFVYGRSAVPISEGIISKLTTMESAVLGGTHRRIGFGELTDVLTDNLIHTVEALTDEQIVSVSLSLRVLPDWQVSPESDFVALRSSRADPLTRDDFTKAAKAFRDSDGPLAAEWRKVARLYVEEDVKNRLEVFGAAVPEQWADATTSGLTPLQVFIVAYSAFADDLLADSITGLQDYLATIQSEMALISGSYPSPSGRFAFGVNGYIYSTPLDLLFNHAAMWRLLSQVEARYEQ